MPAPQRPLPVPDAISAPFWQGAKEGELRVQQCERCSKLAYPPAISCLNCGSQALTFRAVSGRARLHSWTVLHDAPAPGFADRLPLILGVVELEEQAHLLMSTNLLDIAEKDLRLDLPLVAVFESVSDEVSLVQFRPAVAR